MNDASVGEYLWVGRSLKEYGTRHIAEGCPMVVLLDEKSPLRL
jgi:hypothetical protein